MHTDFLTLLVEEHFGCQLVANWLPIEINNACCCFAANALAMVVGFQLFRFPLPLGLQRDGAESGVYRLLSISTAGECCLCEALGSRGGGTVSRWWRSED